MPGHSMKQQAKVLVCSVFKRHGITVFIDNGWLGGGNQVGLVGSLSFDPDAARPPAGNNNDFWDYKWGNGWDVNGNGAVDGGDNLHGNFDASRFRIFHYAILGEEYAEYPHSTGRGDLPGDDFFVADEKLKHLALWVFEIPLDHTKIQASTFMHELGHNLGLEHNGNRSLCRHADPNNDGIAENHVHGGYLSEEPSIIELKDVWGAGCPYYVSIMSYEYQLNHYKWPEEWNGAPNYGTRPGDRPGDPRWDDWEHLNLQGVGVSTR